MFTFGLTWDSMKSGFEDWTCYKRYPRLCWVVTIVVLLFLWPFALGVHIQEFAEAAVSQLSNEDDDEEEGEWGLGDWWKRN